MMSEPKIESNRELATIGAGAGPVYLAAAVVTPVRRLPRQPVAYTDEEICRLWLGNLKSEHTRESYTRDLRDFLGYLAGQSVTCLADVTRADVQAWQASASMAAKSPASRARALASIKSLFKFAAVEEHVSRNPAAGVNPPRVTDDEGRIAERILDESEVQQMFAHEPNLRNGVLLRLLYASGCRVSEVCGLTWGDVRDRDADRGQITVKGKGNKTRSIVLSASMYAKLKAIKPSGAAATNAVFASRKGGGAALNRQQVTCIVRAAAKRAGLDKSPSAHWLRHCSASHSLDRGATPALVQQTLGHASLRTTGHYLHVRPGQSSGECLPV